MLKHTFPLSDEHMTDATVAATVCHRKPTVYGNSPIFSFCRCHYFLNACLFIQNLQVNVFVLSLQAAPFDLVYKKPVVDE